MATKRRSNLNGILENRLKWLNELLGTPTEPYSRQDESTVCNVGNIHVDGNIGGYRLEQIVRGGGTRPCGTHERVSKSRLIEIIDVALDIAEQARKRGIDQAIAEYEKRNMPRAIETPFGTATIK